MRHGTYDINYLIVQTLGDKSSLDDSISSDDHPSYIKALAARVKGVHKIRNGYEYGKGGYRPWNINSSSGSSALKKLHCIYYDDSTPDHSNIINQNVLFRKGKKSNKSKSGKSSKNSRSKGSYSSSRGSSSQDGNGIILVVQGKGASYNNYGVLTAGKGKGGFILGGNGKGKGFTFPDFTNYGDYDNLLNNGNRGKGSPSFKKNRTCKPVPEPTLAPVRPPPRPFPPQPRQTNKPIALPATRKPVATATSIPTSEIEVNVFVPEYFIAMVSIDPKRSPTQAEFQQMMDITTKYYTQYFVDYYKNNSDKEFLRIENTLLNTAFNFGFPEPRHNIIMVYNSKVVFKDGSVQPGNLEIFEVMRLSIAAIYITDWVRTAVGTPFETVNEVYMARRTPDIIIP